MPCCHVASTVVQKGEMWFVQSADRRGDTHHDCSLNDQCFYAENIIIDYIICLIATNFAPINIPKWVTIYSSFIMARMCFTPKICNAVFCAGSLVKPLSAPHLSLLLTRPQKHKNANAHIAHSICLAASRSKQKHIRDLLLVGADRNVSIDCLTN